MQSLFDVDFDYATKFFNYAIGAWNTSGVTTMLGMFWEASSFDQLIGVWNVEKVTDMNAIFAGASSFNQDLGWFVYDFVKLDSAFLNTACESTLCGVTKIDQTPAPTGGCRRAAPRLGRFSAVLHVKQPSYVAAFACGRVHAR